MDDAVTFEAPKHGDWDRVSHTMESWYQKYQDDFIGPTQREILVEHFGEEARAAAQTCKFNAHAANSFG